MGYCQINDCDEGQQSSAHSVNQLDVVIVNYNAGEALQAAVDSVLACKQLKVRCILVDNASSDNSLAFLAEYPYKRVKLLRNTRNYGFAVAVNQGAAVVQTDFFLLLNPDTVVSEQALQGLLLAACESSKAGVLGCLIVNPDGSEQRGCRRDMPTPLLTLAHGLRLQNIFPALEFNHTQRPLPDQAMPVPAISGACMLIRRTAHEQIGGFDESFFLHFEDLDYCARLAHADWQVLFVPSVVITHQQGVSSASRPVRVALYKAQSMWRFLWRHGGKQKWLVPILLPLIALRAVMHAGYLSLVNLVRLLK